MKNYIKNKKHLIENNAYDPSLEHEACGVGLIATTDGKKSRKVVEYGIEALKAVWHRGAVDACLLYTSPSPRDRTRSRMPSSA